MIEYAPGDKDKLINHLISLYGIDVENAGLHSAESEAHTFVRMNDGLQCISMNILLKIVLHDPAKDPCLEKEVSKKFMEVLELIHFVPLRRVPLYLNTIPDVANWRLRIGK